MNEKPAASLLEAAIARLFEATDQRAAIAAAPVAVRPYVQLFADLQAAAVPPPSDAFRLALRARLVGQARSRATRPTLVTPRLQRVAAAGVAAIVFGSALQPALARELVHHLRLTFGESIAELVQSAMDHVPSLQDDELPVGESGAEPADQYAAPGLQIAPATIDSIAPETEAPPAASSNADAPQPRVSVPGSQVPNAIAAEPGTPETPAPSEADPGVTDTRNIPRTPAPQPNERGSASAAAGTSVAVPPHPESVAGEEPSQILPGDEGPSVVMAPSPGIGQANAAGTPGNSPATPSEQANANGTPGNSPAIPPGQANADGTPGNSPAIPPEQANANGTPGNSPAIPPGQANAASTPGNSPAIPPGQANTDGNPGNSPATPPGQANADGTPGNSPATPPGQANTDGIPGNSPAIPPGQANAGGTPGNSPAIPPGQANADDTRGNAPTTPPGQANADGTPGNSPATPPGQANANDAP